MTVTIYPSAPAGTVAAPPSKSAAHRLMLCARFGVHLLRGAEPSEDVRATADCLGALGVPCEFVPEGLLVRGGAFRVPPEGATLHCRESGSTLRFLLPLCLTGPEVTLRGSPRLLARPLGVYQSLCRERGIFFDRSETGVTVRGTLRSGEFSLPGDVSSQFVTGLLLALPFLPGDSLLSLRPPVESRSYIGMTIDALAKFGVAVRWLDGERIEIPGGQRAAGPETLDVEGDWSNAAPFLALGDAVRVTGLDPDSPQGDKVCKAYLQKPGREALDLSDCPDLGPVLFAAAALRGGGRFTGTRRLRLKESDRAEAMKTELAKFGVSVHLEENSAEVRGVPRPPAKPLDSHNDHRIVMALSLLCLRTGGTIRGAEAVGKSFPGYFERLRALGVRMEERTE